MTKEWQRQLIRYSWSKSYFGKYFRDKNTWQTDNFWDVWLVLILRTRKNYSKERWAALRYFVCTANLRNKFYTKSAFNENINQINFCGMKLTNGYLNKTYFKEVQQIFQDTIFILSTSSIVSRRSSSNLVSKSLFSTAFQTQYKLKWIWSL